jgi:dienelactone hydrolase
MGVLFEGAGRTRRGLQVVNKTHAAARTILLVVVLAACTLAGCGRGGPVRATVAPMRSVEDQPVHITVRGLSPHERVALELASTDAKGVRWISTARFTASGRGIVDPDRSAPSSGDYTGVWGMGLLSMMYPAGRAPVGAYFWAGNRPMQFRLSVKAGSKTLASTDFTRRFASTALTTRPLSLKRTGFIGRFDYPAGASRRPAIVALGGSEGGLPGPLISDVLAAHGYAVLSLAYFKLPGLPQNLRRIPLEYFQRALAWLHRQPQVDPKRIAILGISRGSEAALLSGAYFPRLVSAVIALVPSDVALCSIPGCLGPAWTFHGHAVPYTREFDTPAPTDNPRAVIPVQRIRGPVFLACGGADTVWTSCPYAQAIIHHLNVGHDTFGHVLYTYPTAGHGVGLFIPYEPITVTLFYDDLQADQRARAKDWPRLLDFLGTWARRG